MSSISELHPYQSLPGIWDEMYDGSTVRPQYQNVYEVLQQADVSTLQLKEHLAGKVFMNQGITFTVYSEDTGIERIFPFDIIPRILTSAEWEHIESGIKQRLRALNSFLKDIY